MSETIKVLFLGDLVGRPGREATRNFLQGTKADEDRAPGDIDACGQIQGCAPGYDFIIANVENASHGFGLTKKNHDELISYGIDCMTSGNHIWDKKDIYTFIDDSSVLIRPLNYHKTARGVGYRIFNNKIIVINLLGKTFMQPVICPFQALYDVMVELQNDIGLEDKIIIVDFHAEATAEKICFANFAKSLGVSAVFGTHTHVQTADERVIDTNFNNEEEFKYFPKEENDCVLKPKDTLAYISDVGFCGAGKSVIGMEYFGSLKRLVSSIPERFDVATSDVRQINAVEVEFDEKSGAALKIGRINFNYKVTRSIGA